jgi:dUTP pyrophosphatase
MTAETTSAPNEPIVPTSPPAKRIKTDTSANTATSETMASSNGTATQQQELQPPPLLIKKLSDKARIPTRGSAFAAGYDLCAARLTTIPARGKALVDTDISMSLPAGTCKFICLTVPVESY